MSLPSQMLAVQAEARGAADVLRPQRVPVPQPGPGQVLLRVEAASVNFSDVKRRRGDVYPFPTAFPFVPGGEVAGTVAALGAGVDGPPAGTPVFALAGGDGHGGYAQFALAMAPHVVPRPPQIDAAAASTLLVAGATALLALGHTARVQPGEAVFVGAAAGGVGQYALQIARALGAGVVLGGVGSAAKAAAVRAAGAHDAIDVSAPDWADAVRRATGGRGVDVLIESSGAALLAQGLQALAPFGRAVVLGAASGRSAVLDAATVDRLLYDPAPNQALFAFNLGSWFVHRPQAAGAALGTLIGFVASGQVRVPPIRTLALTDAAQAHRLLETRQTSGKLVLDPWQ